MTPMCVSTVITKDLTNVVTRKVVVIQMIFMSDPSSHKNSHKENSCYFCYFSNGIHGCLHCGHKRSHNHRQSNVGIMLQMTSVHPSLFLPPLPSPPPPPPTLLPTSLIHVQMHKWTYTLTHLWLSNLWPNVKTRIVTQIMDASVWSGKQNKHMCNIVLNQWICRKKKL